MSTKQLLAEIDRGIRALQKARALCLKGETVAPSAKATAQDKQGNKCVSEKGC